MHVRKQEIITQKRPPWLYLVFLGLAIAIPGIYHVTGLVNVLENFDLARLQLIGFPLLIILALGTRFLGHRIPKLVLIFACLGVFSGLKSAFSLKYLSTNEFLLARFSGDQHEAETHKFREDLNLALKTQELAYPHAKAIRFAESLSTEEEVKKLFDKREDLKVLVWAKGENLKISLKDSLVLSLDNFRPAKLKKDPALMELEKLALIPNFSEIEVDLGPMSATRSFVASLMSPLLEYQNYLDYKTGKRKGFRFIRSNRLRTKIGYQLDSLALDLYHSGSIVAGWSNYSHRALPWLLYANTLMLNELQKRSPDIAALDCAAKAYKIAAGFTDPSWSPYLRPAIFNNLALSLSLKYALSGDKKMYKKAIESFNKALDLERQKTDKKSLKKDSKYFRTIQKNKKTLARARKGIRERFKSKEIYTM